LDELDKMGVAYALEKRDAVAAELLVAERRYRQQLIATRSFQIKLSRVKRKLQRMNEKVGVMLNVNVRGRG
jgi:hypothetical protein